MSIPPQRPKWSVRGGVGAVPVEQVHIMRDPPKSVMLRKKERVSFDDVAHLHREDTDRISDHISYYAKGVNPAVSVSYSNYGNGNNSSWAPAGSGAQYAGTMPTSMAVNKDGAFHLPIQKREDYYDSLSRMPRSYVAYNPTININAQPVQINQEAKIDKDIIRHSIRPSATYNIGEVDRPYLQNKVVDPVHYTMIGNPELPQGDAIRSTSLNKGIIYKPSIAMASGFGNALPTYTMTDTSNMSTDRHIKDRPLIAMMTPVFTIAIKNDVDNNLHYINIPEKEKVKIATRADARLPIEIKTDSGQAIKLKDYNWVVYQPHPDAPSTLILEQNPDGIRVKDLTTKAIMSTITSSYNRYPEVLAPELEKRQATISVKTNVTPLSIVDNVNRNINLPDHLKLESYETRGFIPAFEPIEHHAVGINQYRSELKKKAFDLYSDRWQADNGPRGDADFNRTNTSSF